MILTASVGPYGAALIGAVGGVIGGLLTFGSNMLIERSRAKRDEKSSNEREQGEILQAGRLVLEELTEVDEALQQAIRSGFTWPADRQLPAFAWREYRAVLAKKLPLPGWRWVVIAYAAANQANWHVIQLQREFETDGPVHFADKEWLREPLRAVRQAMEDVEAATGGPRAGVFT